MRLIVAGDTHLGRSSSRLPEEHGVDPTARGAWFRFIDLAIHRKADAVLITGDLIDKEEAYYEARSTVRGGLEKLLEACPEITVVAISGNHDAESLPRVIKALDLPGERVRLLGRDGAWERTEINGEDGLTITLDGWSYPNTTTL